MKKRTGLKNLAAQPKQNDQERYKSDHELSSIYRLQNHIRLFLEKKKLRKRPNIPEMGEFQKSLFQRCLKGKMAKVANFGGEFQRTKIVTNVGLFNVY